MYMQSSFNYFLRCLIAVRVRWYMRLHLWLLFLLVFAGLSACSSLSPKQDGRAGVNGESLQLSQRFTGRISVVVQENQTHAKPQNTSARFDLHTDNGSNGQLMLASPLGNTVAQVRWSPVEAVVTDNYAEQTRYDSFEAMMQEMIGVRLEAQTLLGWLQPSSQEQFIHGDWQVDARGYNAASKSGKIKAVRTEPLPTIRIVVLLDEQ